MSIQFPDAVQLTDRTAAALDALHIVPVSAMNVSLPAMAWLALVLRELPDTDERFPRGKWATIHYIEGQLHAAAKARAAEIPAGGPS